VREVNHSWEHSVMTHRIVSAGVSEIDRVEPLWHAMVVHHERVIAGAWPVRTPTEAWRRRRAEYVEWLTGGEAWLLLAVPAGEDAAAPDGYAIVRLQPSGSTWDLGDRIGELESLSVAEHARGAGVGTRLIAAARDSLRERGIGYWSVSVVEANAAAERLYEREGFRPFYRSLLAPV
jgi:ribosomal protein S18 acetylase RimI-like enzyme